MTALTRWPTDPKPWLVPWTIWLLRGKPSPRPSVAPKDIPQYGWEFWTWVKWRRANRPPPRPDIVKDIPQWAYPLLQQIMIAVPLVPPPPPPPPPNPDPPDSWSLPFPILYTSWGWTSDSAWRDTDEGLNKAVNAGFKTIALQGGLFRPHDPDRCRAKGLKVVVWGQPSLRDADYLAAADADGYNPQIESTDEYDNAVKCLEAGIGRGLSLASITTLSGFYTYTSRNAGTPQEHPTTEETEKLARLGLTRHLIECYTGPMEPMSVDQMMFTARRWRGMYYTRPVIGLARDHVSVGTYQGSEYGDIEPYGREIGSYLAEPMTPADWQAIGAL